MAEKTDVVVVGGGIGGCATAYFLAQKGIKTTLIEKESIGWGASGFAAGLLNPLHGLGIPGPLEGLARESFRIHLSLAEEVGAESGIDPQLRGSPCIYLAFNDGEREESLEHLHLAERAKGFSARWLEFQELKSLEPKVSPQVIGGVCVEGTRQVDAYQYTQALAKAAERHGAIIRADTVQRLSRDSGRVSGVVLGDGDIQCDKVVLAMGPWTGEVEAWLGVPVPIGPLRGQILRLELPGRPLKHALYRSGGGYVTSKSDGLIWVGTTEERVGFDNEPTQEARVSIMKEALEIMPALSDSRMILQTACLRPVSEDGLPIIDQVPGWDGVYLATGAGRKGILLGPGMAKATADMVTNGHTDLPVEPFSLGRFARAA